MHHRNPYRAPIDFASLAQNYPSLRPFLIRTSDGCTIEFKNVEAQRCLTQALLWRDFGLKFSLPEGRLCPPVPNRPRLNYILWVQDVIAESFISLERDIDITGIDIGTGASAIYPLLGCKVDPSWNFIGTEIDPTSHAYAIENVRQNNMTEQITVLKVPSSDYILAPFREYPNKQFTFTMCNPPFYTSAEDVERSAEGKILEPNSVCTGSEVEMITPGGEEAFVKRMFEESAANDVKDRWFTSMVGKFSSLEKIVGILRSHNVDNYALTELVQGQTRRWVVAWSFSDLRIPDILARNLPSAHHALLPLHNGFEQVLRNADSVEPNALHGIVLNVLATLDDVTIEDIAEKIGSTSSVGVTRSTTTNGSTLALCFRASALRNTWTRSARRAVKSGQHVHSDEPRMVVDVFAERRLVKGNQSWVLSGQWRRGRDHDLFTSFWSHVSRKVATAFETSRKVL